MHKKIHVNHKWGKINFMTYFAIKLITFNKTNQLNINCIVTLYIKREKTSFHVIIMHEKKVASSIQNIIINIGLYKEVKQSPNRYLSIFH